MTSYGDCGTATACAAGTETLVATINILPGGNYSIRKIRVAISQDAASEGASGFVELKIDKVSGPFKFPVGMSSTIVSSGGGGASPADEIDVDIPVPGSAQVKIYATMTEACDVVAGITYVG